jgi:N-acetylmuramoyl-L-alanine amidase
VNISLGRSAYAQGYQSASGTKIESISSLKRGDIVCYNTISDSDLVDHVGIYLGDGYFIHASSGTSNGKQVCISSLTSGYYNRVFSWGRRPLE